VRFFYLKLYLKMTSSVIFGWSKYYPLEVSIMDHLSLRPSLFRGHVSGMRLYNVSLLLQLKAAQLEWNHNWQILNEKKMTMEPSSEQPVAHPSRHQRLLKKHVVDLEKASKSLHRDNERLKTRFLKVEEELELLQKYVQNKEAGDQEYDRINGNDIQDYIRMEKVKEVGRSDFARQQQSNTESIANLTKQMSNFDKLHMSMLELLENVESIENKVDVSFPEFRKEISKLEIQIADAVSQISLLREDQTNTRKSVKAIGVSVSNLQDKTDTDRGRLKKTEEQVDSLTKSASMQTSKLHDHILKVGIEFF
jgi:chromosome segregation ATPase